MSEPFKPGWFVVELMGHRRYVGHVVEVRVAGAELLRVDIPGKEPVEVTFGAASIYSMRRTTESLVRDEIRREEESELRRAAYQLSAPAPLEDGDVEQADELGDADAHDLAAADHLDYDDGRTP